MEIEKVGVKVV